MKIGFIGFGEVGYEMSKGFLADGVDQIYAFDVMHGEEYVKSRAKEAGIELLSSPIELVAMQLDVMFVAVPSQHTYSAWESVYKNLDDHTIYVDVTTASASTKQLIFENLLQRNKKFVDVALMGPLPTYKNRVPSMASGSGADSFIELLTPYKMQVDKISDVPGDATNIKFVRSIFMKGIATLLFEVLEIGYQLNVHDRVIQSISKTIDDKPFEQLINRLITGSAIHSERRTKEMDHVIDLLNEHNKEPMMSQAILEKLTKLTDLGLREKFNHSTPKDWRIVIEKVNQLTNQTNESVL